MNSRSTAAPSLKALLLIPVLLAGIALFASEQNSTDTTAQRGHGKLSRMKGHAGTAFNLNAQFDPSGNPVFPWNHEVRGIVQLSNLGNCTADFKVSINAGSSCDGEHVFCLNGTVTITTLAGDTINAEVAGWADPDPNDPNQMPNMNLLHYDVTITSGTGALTGARGRGQIDGAFFFCNADCFCDSYAGVATWLYDGVLQLPHRRGR